MTQNAFQKVHALISGARPCLKNPRTAEFIRPQGPNGNAEATAGERDISRK